MKKTIIITIIILAAIAFLVPKPGDRYSVFPSKKWNRACNCLGLKFDLDGQKDGIYQNMCLGIPLYRDKVCASDLRCVDSNDGETCTTGMGCDSSGRICGGGSCVGAGIGECWNKKCITMEEAIKDWVALKDDNLDYVFRYPDGFFPEPPKVSIFDCPDSDCQNLDIKGLEGADRADENFIRPEKKTIRGWDFCFQSFNKAALGTRYATYRYIRIKGGKCAVLDLVKDYPNCVNIDKENPAFSECEKKNAAAEETIGRIERSIASPK